MEVGTRKNAGGGKFLPQHENPEKEANAFDRLIAWLDADREHAGQKYESIRRKLLKFFQGRGCVYAEEFADEAIERVTKNIARGDEVGTGNVEGYFLGVARNILRDYWKQQKLQPTSIELLPVSQLPSTNPNALDEQEALGQQRTRRLACMRRCLEALPEEKRLLIKAYQAEEKRERTASRQKLAQWLQMSENALRIRAHRIRQELTACVAACLKKWNEVMK